MFCSCCIGPPTPENGLANGLQFHATFRRENQQHTQSMNQLLLVRSDERYTFLQLTLPLNGVDGLLTVLPSIPWYSNRRVAIHITTTSHDWTTRHDIRHPHHPGLAVCVFSPPPNKVWLISRNGLMCELMDNGTIVTDPTQNESPVDPRGTFWFNGHCGSLRQFSSVVDNLKELHRAILQSVAPQLEGSGADESRMDEDESDRDDSGDERHPTIRRRMKQEQQHEQ